MKWVSLPEAVTGVSPGGTADRPAPADLAAEYRAGRTVGVVTLGARHLFFRRLWKAYYIPYGSISRLFRRVIAVPAKIGCCTTGEVRVEHLVVCGASDSTEQCAERELAQIQLPGERAALALMEDLKRLAPGAAFGRPPTPAESPDRGTANPADNGGGEKEAGA